MRTEGGRSAPFEALEKFETKGGERTPWDGTDKKSFRPGVGKVHPKGDVGGMSLGSKKGEVCPEMVLAGEI